MAKGELTRKQRMFCAEYMIDFNGKQSAIRAGYSPKTAEFQASVLLRNRKVATEVKRLQDEKIQATGITAEYVIKSLHEVAEFTKAPRPRYNKAGDIVGEGIDSAGATRSLELLGKHLGVFDNSDGPQKIQIDLCFPDAATWTRPYHEGPDEG
jgi:phage terminase small subunit